MAVGGFGTMSAHQNKHHDKNDGILTVGFGHNISLHNFIQRLPTNNNIWIRSLGVQPPPFNVEERKKKKTFSSLYVTDANAIKSVLVKSRYQKQV